MNNRLTIVIALVAGLLGGILTRYVAPPTASAQNPAPSSKEIRAQSFTLVDSANRTVGIFTTEVGAPTAPPAIVPIPPTPNPSPAPPSGRGPSAPRIVLRDSSGREIWSPEGTPRIVPAVQR